MDFDTFEIVNILIETRTAIVSFEYLIYKYYITYLKNISKLTLANVLTEKLRLKCAIIVFMFRCYIPLTIIFFLILKP